LVVHENLLAYTYTKHAPVGLAQS